MRRVQWVLMGTVFTLVACMTTTHGMTLAGGDSGRPGLGQVQLGDGRSAVMSAMTPAYQEPVCEVQKIGMKNSRRAFLLESCRFEGGSETLEGAPISELVLHFIDEQLLRIDVATGELDRETTEPLIAALQSRFGQPTQMSADTGAEALPDDGMSGNVLTVWQSGEDAVALRRFISTGADTRVLLHMQNTTVAEQSSALAAW